MESETTKTTETTIDALKIFLGTIQVEPITINNINSNNSIDGFLERAYSDSEKQNLAQNTELSGSVVNPSPHFVDVYCGLYFMFVKYKNNKNNIKDVINEFKDSINEYTFRTFKLACEIDKKLYLEEDSFLAGLMFFHLLPIYKKSEKNTQLTTELLEKMFKTNEHNLNQIVPGTLFNLKKYFEREIRKNTLNGKPYRNEVRVGTVKYYKLLLNFVKNNENDRDNLYKLDLDYCDDIDPVNDFDEAVRAFNPKRYDLAKEMSILSPKGKAEKRKAIKLAKQSLINKKNPEQKEKKAARAAQRIWGIVHTEDKGVQESLNDVNSRLASHVKLEKMGGGGGESYEIQCINARNIIGGILLAEAKAVEAALKKQQSEPPATEATTGGGAGETSVKEQSLSIRKNIRDIKGKLSSVKNIITRYANVLNITGLKERIKGLEEGNEKQLQNFGSEYHKLTQETPGILKEVSETINACGKIMKSILIETTAILSLGEANSVISKKKDLLKRYVEGNFDDSKKEELTLYGNIYLEQKGERAAFIESGLNNVLQSIDADVKSAFQTAISTMQPVGDAAYRRFEAELKAAAAANQGQGPFGNFLGALQHPVNRDGGEGVPKEQGVGEDLYVNATKKVAWVLDNIEKIFDDPLKYVDKFTNVRSEGAIVGDTSLLTNLFSKYVENKDTKGELLAGKDLINELDANKLMPATVLAIDSTDKFVFIAVTMFIRLLSLYITYFLVNNGTIKKLGYSLMLFITLYVSLLFAMAIIVNINEYKMRIVFNFMNFHINDTGFYTYMGIAIAFTFAIVMLMNFVNFPFTNMGNDYTNAEERDKMLSRLELITAFIWLLLSIVVFLT